MRLDRLKDASRSSKYALVLVIIVGVVMVIDPLGINQNIADMAYSAGYTVGSFLRSVFQ